MGWDECGSLKLARGWWTVDLTETPKQLGDVRLGDGGNGHLETVLYSALLIVNVCIPTSPTADRPIRGVDVDSELSKGEEAGG